MMLSVVVIFSPKIAGFSQPIFHAEVNYGKISFVSRRKGGTLRTMFILEKEAMIRICERLKDVLKDNLVALVAFGSRVRGDFDGDSDFDVLVIVKERDAEVIDIINDVFEIEEDKATIPFSPVIKPLDVFEKERRYDPPFYRNIKREGIAFYGAI